MNKRVSRMISSTFKRNKFFGETRQKTRKFIVTGTFHAFDKLRIYIVD